MENLTGRQFGPYQIVAPLGEGGMAAVYKAYQPSMERHVALKVLPRHFAEDPQFVARFQREAILLAKLQHPHILPVFDYGQSDGFTYIVMPFVQSGTLTDALTGKPLLLPRISQVISQVGDALSYAHSRGMIHRDIKPSNILVDESGNCLLTDFGLARMLEDSVNLTSSGTIMGTPAYMAPEQGSGQKVDARSDIYSLGVVLYEMATGRVPYKAETPIAVVFKHINDPLPPARTINPNLPEAVELVIFKALAKNPEHRYQSADAMVRAIQAAVTNTMAIPVEDVSKTIKAPVAQDPAPENQVAQGKLISSTKKVKPSLPDDHQPARPWVWGVLGILVLLVGAFGLFTVLNNNESPDSEQVAAIVTTNHYIGIQVVSGIGKFYERTTGDAFIPRGMNYIHLAQQTRSDGSFIVGHALFDPDQYDSSQVGTDLENMHEAGFNIIRVFLSPDTMGTSNGGLSPDYMKNVANLLQFAKQYQIYVILTQDGIPGGKYGTILNEECCSNFASVNASLLSSAGLKANQTFYQDLIRALVDLNAPVEYIFSYEIRNELYYDADQAPLSLEAGVIKTANGKSYDMSEDLDKQAMIEENLVYWIDEMRSSILEADPTALVSVGFFEPQETDEDPRLSVPGSAIVLSTADFIDVHTFLGNGLELSQYVENFGIRGIREKPIMMGEFGAEINQFSSAQEAALAITDWQIESCRYGFDGWIFWNWETYEGLNLFTTQIANDSPYGVLAPVVRQNPCLP